jgi:DNA polymerase I
VRRAFFDIETDGLLDTVSAVHCVVVKDQESGVVFRGRADEDGSIMATLSWLSQYDEIIGHNIVGYDLPALEKLGLYTPSNRSHQKIADTLVMAYAYMAHIKDSDFDRWRAGKLPGALIGRHSLEAWGYRLGVLKGDYGKQTNAWDTFTPEMLEYCVQDVELTAKLYEHLTAAQDAPEALALDHKLMDLMQLQQRHGVGFDMDAALALDARLRVEERDAFAKVLDALPTVVQVGKEFVPKRDNKKLGYIAGVPMQKIAVKPLNPKARQQVAKALKTAYGWESPKKTETGLDSLDDDVLMAAKDVPLEVREALAKYWLVGKRLGQISDGKGAWMKYAMVDPARECHLIYGRTTPGGTVTHRAAHSSPNLGQVPKVGSPYGAECRALFAPPPGYVMVGADVSGLELRCLAHFLARYDGGRYMRLVLEGDPHALTRDVIGAVNSPAVQQMAKESGGDPMKIARDVSKTWIYAWLYGAGDQKLGSILHPNASEKTQKDVGRRLKFQFANKVPGMKQLQADIAAKTKSTGYFIMPDGRRVYVRHAHAALNTLLQAAGAIICRMWLVEKANRITAAIGAPGIGANWCPMLWVHDETQDAVKPEHAALVARIAEEAITAVGERIGWRCRLNGEAKIGQNWRDTH